MTRRHYRKIAVALSRVRPLLEPNGLYLPTVTEIAKVLSADNPRFNYQKFLLTAYSAESPTLRTVKDTRHGE